ncbi:RNA polymerase sigma factor [Kordiimonas sp.]|uniref:RNA polymerase sigma factor n=1 Tax=Kordiimonas sp. TaxID=1970157 RepID=UPI003A95A3C2
MNRAEEDLLVLKAQSGDGRAFGVLYGHYNPSLRRFAFRLCGDEQLALDAVQETWVSLTFTLKKIEDPRAFRVWLYRTVRWRIVDLVRKRGADLEPLEEAEVADTAPAPHLATSSQLGAHIRALPDEERVTLVLFYLEEMKLTEIAAVLAIPVGTVKSRLFRAREHLRQQMSGDE